MQQAHQIAEDGEVEAGHHLLGHGRAAEHVAPLKHQRLQAGAREIGAAGQSVMAASDDDRVIPFGHPSAPDDLACIKILGRYFCQQEKHGRGPMNRVDRSTHAPAAGRTLRAGPAAPDRPGDSRPAQGARRHARGDGRGERPFRRLSQPHRARPRDAVDQGAACGVARARRHDRLVLRARRRAGGRARPRRPPRAAAPARIFGRHARRASEPEI